MKKSTKMRAIAAAKYCGSMFCGATLMTMGAVYGVVGVAACCVDKKMKKEYLFTSAVGTVFGVSGGKLISTATNHLIDDLDKVHEQKKLEKNETTDKTPSNTNA